MQREQELINPAELGKHPGYSQGVRTASGKLLFVAGQVGWDDRGVIVSSEFTEQFAKALANVITVVRAAGGSPDTIARMTIYVLDKKEYLANLKGIGKLYREQMGSHYPAMTLLEVKGLLEEGAKVEIEATAAL